MTLKRANNSSETSSRASKRQANNTSEEPVPEPQIIPKSSNKSSWVWDYFVEKTDGRVYCQYIEKKGEEEIVCGVSLQYKSQTSSMSYHLAGKHKVYNKRKEQVVKFFDECIIFSLY